MCTSRIVKHTHKTQTIVYLLTMSIAWQGVMTKRNGVITVETFHADEAGNPLETLAIFTRNCIYIAAMITRCRVTVNSIYTYVIYVESQ